MPEKPGCLYMAIAVAVMLAYVTKAEQVSSTELGRRCTLLLQLVHKTWTNIDKAVKPHHLDKSTPELPKWMTSFKYPTSASISRGKLYKRGARQLSWFNGVFKAIILTEKDVEEFETPLTEISENTIELINAMRQNAFSYVRRMSKRSALPYKFEESWAGKTKDEKLSWISELLQEMNSKYLRWIKMFFRKISREDQ